MPPSWSRVIQIQAWAIVALIVCVLGLSVAVAILQSRNTSLVIAVERTDYEMAKLRFIAEKSGARGKAEYEKAARALTDFMKTYPDASTYRRLTEK